MSASPNMSAALALAKTGLHIFACKPDKVPLHPGWEQNATSDSLKIEATWTGAAHLLPAIPAGAHRLVIIDCDVKDGKQGVAAFHALCQERGIDLSKGFQVDTPSGGQHWYFRTDVPYGNSVGKVAPGVDTRAVGGYCIAPGATLPDGRSYKIVQGTWNTIPALPEALAALLKPKELMPPPDPTNSTAGLPATIAPYQATDRDRDYGASALESIGGKLDVMQPGDGRNDALNTESFSAGTLVGNGSVSYDIAKARLILSAERNGHTAKHGLAQTIATIESGLHDGMEKPRPLKSQEPKADLSELLNTKAAPAKEWPATLNDDAYIGIAGDFVHLVAPQTEGDPCALLIAFLTVVGSLVGRTAYLPVGPTHHYGNLFSVIVAETSKGRKGTVMAEAKRFATMIDPSISERMLGGLSSGEGLIEAVRDARFDDAQSEQGKLSIAKVIDKGVTDKRLLVCESEMGQALQAAGREGNILSAVLRMSWDGDELRTLARSNKNVCRQPHISIFGNITLDELQRLLTSTDRTNGFANRFLWICARRSQELPWGGRVDEAALQALAAKAAHAIDSATYYGECGWMPDAASLWAREYSRLSAGSPGLAGAMSARAEAQTIRIALIYAILDGCNNVDLPHLKAALEVWRYCQDSVDYCFGRTTSNPTANRIYELLIFMPEGASLTQISNLFGRNKKSAELQRALNTLKESNMARSETKKTGGRAAEYWFAL